MAVETVAKSPSKTPCHCAHDGHDHALIRCGCTNDLVDAGHTHDDHSPVRKTKEAFHLIWCCSCGTYCSKDVHCPAPLPCLQAAASGALQKRRPTLPLLFKLPLQLLSLPMHLFASIRSWFGRLAPVRVKEAPVLCEKVHH